LALQTCEDMVIYYKRQREILVIMSLTQVFILVHGICFFPYIIRRTIGLVIKLVEFLVQISVTIKVQLFNRELFQWSWFNLSLTNRCAWSRCLTHAHWIQTNWTRVIQTILDWTTGPVVFVCCEHFTRRYFNTEKCSQKY